MHIDRTGNTGPVEVVVVGPIVNLFQAGIVRRVVRIRSRAATPFFQAVEIGIQRLFRDVFGVTIIVIAELCGNQIVLLPPHQTK